MKTADPKPTLLSQYKPPNHRIDNIFLTFKLHPTRTIVTSKMTITPIKKSKLFLDGSELKLKSISLNGLDYLSKANIQKQGLYFNSSDLPGKPYILEIVTEINPEKNTSLEGLYISNGMYCTQCEAEGFRKITYYQDRPDIMAKFKVRVESDLPVRLSNGNKTTETKNWSEWEDPWPKPSYLFALVAGELLSFDDHFVTKSGKKIALKIWVREEDINKCAFAMDALKRSMSWDEVNYGREYDLDIFQIVAVNDFNMGAMENKGLNVFNTSCVLASPDTATDDAYQRVEAVVAHEYFHNWSGNRVTCRDWFQLSLKEGFTVFRDAEFSSDMNSRAVKRIEDVGFLRSIQFAEDAGPLAHPVRPNSYMEISNFYTTTIYEKGAEVVRMYHTLLGQEAFRRGTDLYFDRHDGTAATTDDFAQAMSEAGGIDLNQFKLWYEQPGTPQVEVRESFADGTLNLEIVQAPANLPNQKHQRPFHMPLALGLLDVAGDPLSLDLSTLHSDAEVSLRDSGHTLLVGAKESVTHLEVSGLATKPVVSFLRGFSAPVKVTHSRDPEELAFLVRHDTDGFVRWDAMQTLWMQHFDTDIQASVNPVAVLGSLAEDALRRETAEDQLLAATMLSVPNENYLFEQLRGFQVDALLDARDAAVSKAGLAHAEIWAQLVDKHEAKQAYQADAQGMASRALGNMAFSYLCRTLSGGELEQRLEARYRKADNLTDRRTVLGLSLIHI